MTTESNFPESCIKGISAQDQIGQGGNAAPHLFNFKDKIRPDGWKEQSINWNDDEEAISFTLSQERDNGSIQFAYGVAILPTHEIERVKRHIKVPSALSYERDALPGNRYHGNILLRGDIQKPLMRMISANIALFAELRTTNDIHTS